MKKVLLIVAAVMLSVGLTAQTQRGFVKTKGRMVDGKLIPGQGLKGASVSVHGRTTILVNSNDGTFSFPVPDAQFRLDSVRKKGYQLVDMDALSKTYRHSSNPLYLVMETPEQQLQDQLNAERKLRRTLTRQLHEREDEIEALKEQNKITDEEYRQALQKLYDDVDQNEQLVKDMVERYSKIDYDQMSEFDRQISELILNGELTKADSMLRTKGDIGQRLENYRRLEAVNAKEQAELAERQEQLEKSQALALKERDDLANDCFHKFEILKIQHLNDSATYYLELRASLDTTKIEWQFEAGLFLIDYMANYDKALFYFSLALRQSILQYGELSERAATSYNNLGSTYFELGEFDQALEYYEKALNIQIEVLGENNIDAATYYNNVGAVFYIQGNYSKSIEYFEKALSIKKNLPDTSSSDLANCHNNIGVTYLQQGDYKMAVFHLENAVSFLISFLGEDNPYVATCYSNIGAAYELQGDYEKAIEYITKSITINTIALGESHPNTIKMQKTLFKIEYKKSVADNKLKEFYKNHCFTVTLAPENNPEALEEYILLEFADWNQDSPTSLFDKKNELKGKPTDILIMKNDIFSEHHIDNNESTQLGIIQINEEEKQHINSLYEDWKKQNRRQQ